MSLRHAIGDRMAAAKSGAWGELALRCLALTSACFLLSWTAVSFTRATGTVAAFWPATGLILGLLLLSPPRLWPVYLLSGYVAGAAANLTFGDNLLIALGLPLGNALETLLAASALRRLFPGGVNMRDMSHLLALLAVASIAAAASGAAFGAAILETVRPGSFWRSWLNWWTAVSTAILLLTPAVLTWRHIEWRHARVREMTLVPVLAGAGTALAFGQTAFSFLYPIFPLLLWAAVRCGTFATALACIAVSVVAFVMTSLGYGPIARLDFALDVTMRLLQSFLAIVTVTSLAVAMALQRHRETEAALRTSEQRFRDFAEAASDRFWETDENYRFTWLSPRAGQTRMAAERAVGKTRFELLPAEVLREPTWQRHREDIEARRPFRDLRYSRPDSQGNPRIRTLSGRPFFDADGKFLGYRGTGREITETMGAELLATRLGRVMDEALNEVYIVDAKTGRFIFTNRSARENLGYGAKEMEAMTALDLCPEFDGETLKKNYADLDAQPDRRAVVETRHRRKDGTLYDVEAHVQRVDVSGLPPVYAVFAIDVTARKRLLSELDTQSQLLQTTLENMAQGICVYDKDFRLVAFNQRYIELFGFQPGFVRIGGRLEDYLRDEASRGHLGERSVETLLADIRDTLRTRVSRRREIELPNGRIVSANRRPMPDGGFVTTFSDVTEQAKAEAALRRTGAELQALTAKYEAAILASRQMLYEWNTRDGAIVWRGETALILGYAPEELGGLAQLTELVHPDDRSEFVREVHGIDRDDRIFYMEYRLRHKLGHYIHVADRGVYLAGPSGPRERVVGFIADVSKQKASEEAMRQADKLLALGQLTGGVAHDFNNLLGIVRGNLELLSEDIGGDFVHRRRIVTALAAIDRGTALTQRLLAYARKQPLQPQATDLNALVLGLSDLIGRSANERTSIEFGLADGLWPTAIDRNGLETALLNLVLNARDAMPDGGRLRIATRNAELGAGIADLAPGSYVVLTVEDGGSGMTPEVKARAFDPFFTTKEIGRGSGLGLAMVYGFVKQSRGHVTLDSQPGRGTRVEIYLPRSRDAAAPAIAELPGSAAAQGGKLVLIVEDDPDVRAVGESLFLRLGYRTLTAGDGDAAMAALNANPAVRILFTDVSLPGRFDGFELARHARIRRPGIKVLYTSGYNDKANIMDENDKNVVLLPKPYRKEDLLNKLREALDEGDG